MVRIGDIEVGRGRPLALIAGPCVIESRDHALRVAGALAALARSAGIPFIYKSSFDKANRTSRGSFRGVGLELGASILGEVRRELGVPVTTDVHLPDQAGIDVDLLQIPAFLCRQTDLLVAAAATGRPVNVKKGQFLAPWDMEFALEKARGSGGVIATERGTMFGYGDLVVDYRSIPILQDFDVPVCVDVTHAVQRPGSGGKTGGDRRFIPTLARAAIAVGADLLFAEVHDDPPRAPSDAATQLPLDGMAPLLAEWRRLADVVRGG
jgi:2-dehydro-3-deoxyphosphooctonate aldolase (KDO 8-P synthase)